MKRVSPYLKMRVLGAIEFAPGNTIVERIRHVGALDIIDEEARRLNHACMMLRPTSMTPVASMSKTFLDKDIRSRVTYSALVPKLAPVPATSKVLGALLTSTVRPAGPQWPSYAADAHDPLGRPVSHGMRPISSLEYDRFGPALRWRRGLSPSGLRRQSSDSM